MGSIVNKYRVHEVAKDFGVPTKVITEILTKYAQTPKNHMQVLDDRELSSIFEHLTQHNQVSGIQVIFAEERQEPAEKEAGRRSLRPAEKKGEQTPAGSACREAAAEPDPVQAHEPGAPDQGGGYPQGHQRQSG